MVARATFPATDRPFYDRIAKQLQEKHIILQDSNEDMLIVDEDGEPASQAE